MSYILYACIAKPNPAQANMFLDELEGRGFSVSHLGKSDPPRIFNGPIAEASALIFSGNDLTDYTFARDASRRLDFTVEIHHDPRWIHSTVSASCPDLEVLGAFGECALAAFDAFIVVQGSSGGGKTQPWEIIHVAKSCPLELRARFTAA